MAQSAGSPLKAIEDCVHGNRWTDADEAFQELRRAIRKGGQNVPDMAANAQVIFEFLVAFTNRRKIYKRQVASVAGSLLEHDAWRIALAAAPAQLQEDIERLRADGASTPLTSPPGSAGSAGEPAAPKFADIMAASRAAAAAANAPASTATAASASATPGAAGSDVVSAPGVATGPGWAPEWTPSASDHRGAEPRAGVSPTGAMATKQAPGGVNDEFHAIVAVVVKIVAATKSNCEKDADELFSEFRCACDRAKSTPGIFEQESVHATDVLLFVLQLASRKPNKMNQVCEVLTWLHEAPAWCKEMESNQEQVQAAAKDAMLPTDLLLWFGLTSEESEENPQLADDLPLASALAERHLSERNLGISEEESAKSAAQASAEAASDQASKNAEVQGPAATVATDMHKTKAAAGVATDNITKAAADVGQAATAGSAIATAVVADASTSATSRTASVPRLGEAAARATGADSAMGPTGRAGTASAVADAESKADAAGSGWAPEWTPAASVQTKAGVAAAADGTGTVSGTNPLAGPADSARSAGAIEPAGVAEKQEPARRGTPAGTSSRPNEASAQNAQAPDAKRVPIHDAPLGASREHPSSPSSTLEVTAECELRPMNGDYSWVRRANNRLERQLRAEAASWTLLVSQKQIYSKQVAPKEKVRVRLQHVQAMKSGTQLVRSADSISMPQEGSGVAWFRHEPGQLVPVATEKAKLGKKVVAVNAANAYHAGGGFLTGGRHALEEALCMQSTLFQSLLVAEKLALAKGVVAPKSATQSSRGGQSWRCHIPEDGVIFSPNVEFFRGGSDDGYPFWSAAVALSAVVSVAMPNCNPRMRDCPVDAPADDREYLAVLRHKFTAVCKACGLSGARVLVLPDVGCGVFSNNPRDVGKAFGEVLRDEFPRSFDEIHIVGQDAFADACRSAFS